MPSDSFVYLTNVYRATIMCRHCPAYRIHQCTKSGGGNPASMELILMGFDITHPKDAYTWRSDCSTLNKVIKCQREGLGWGVDCGQVAKMALNCTFYNSASELRLNDEL